MISIKDSTLFYVNDIYSKYAWVPLRDKKGITTTQAFQDIVVEFASKPNKIWVEKGSEKPLKMLKNVQKPKNVYTDKLDNIVNIDNNTVHSTIKMKSVNVKSGTYFDFGVEK